MVFWDFLRPLSGLALQFDPFIKGIVAVFALAMFLVAFFAYRKNPSKRLLFVALAFLFFFLKWLVKLLDLFFSPGTFLADSSENVFELIILAFLFFAVLKK